MLRWSVVGLSSNLGYNSFASLTECERMPRHIYMVVFLRVWENFLKYQ